MCTCIRPNQTGLATLTTRVSTLNAQHSRDINTKEMKVGNRAGEKLSLRMKKAPIWTLNTRWSSKTMIQCNRITKTMSHPRCSLSKSRTNRTRRTKKDKATDQMFRTKAKSKEASKELHLELNSNSNMKLLVVILDILFKWLPVEIILLI